MAQKQRPNVNRFQVAVDVLQKGREVLLRDLTEEIIYHAEDFEEGGFLFQEFLENQGTKLHFLYLMLSQLEQSAEAFEASQRRSKASARRSRAKKSDFHETEIAADSEIAEVSPRNEYDAPSAASERSPAQRRPRKVRTRSSVSTSPEDSE
jgi:hypothetical protein